MTRVVIILYIVVFSLYVLFTRQPDLFDGELTSATIHLIKKNNEIIPMAYFSVSRKNYTADVRYLFRYFSEGEKVQVIYDNQDPTNADLYSLWGYIFRWQELVMSIVLLVGLFQIAVQLTNNPTPEALLQELEGRKPKKKRKYDD